MAVLFRTGQQAKLIILRAQDGTALSSTVDVESGTQRLAYVRGKLWLLSSDGYSDLASSAKQARRSAKEAKDPSALTPDGMERSTFDYCFNPGTGLMDYTQSIGYLDSNQGVVSVIDLSNPRGPSLWHRFYARKAPTLVAATRKHLVVVLDRQDRDMFSTTNPRRPVPMPPGRLSDDWTRVWGDQTREVFYAVSTEGLRAYRVKRQDLAPVSRYFYIDSVVETFVDLGKAIALFDRSGGIRVFSKRPRGDLAPIWWKRLSGVPCWPVLVQKA